MIGAVLVVLLLASGCANRSNALGAGDDIEYCTAPYLIERFTEPRPDSRREVLDYASAMVRIIDRVDKRRELTFARDELKAKTPRVRVQPKALADLAVMKVSLVRLRDKVRGLSGDGPQVRAAVNAFSLDRSYLAADERMMTYYLATCKTTD